MIGVIWIPESTPVSNKENQLNLRYKLVKEGWSYMSDIIRPEKIFILNRDV